MLNSPEEYLSALSFEPPESDASKLSSGEKIFIEKYLGLEAFERLPVIHPENEPESIAFHPEPKPSSPEAALEQTPPLTEVFPEPVSFEPEIAQEEIPSPLAEAFLEPEISPGFEAEISETLPNAPELMPQKLVVPTPVETLAMEKPAAIIVETAPQEVVAEPAKKDALLEETPEETPKPVPAPVTKSASAEMQIAEPLPDKAPQAQENLAQISTQASEKLPAQTQPQTSLKESLRNEAEIQMVSFFTAGQLFLLPVLSIQEVLRHQELIKVPQAPEFVAGVINLRGHVMPVVHLSALLTSATEHPYSDRNFIVVCGTDQLKIGLIIDRINSMHVVPQSGMIWNVEAKLGDAAEFLCAIATLDEKVTGVIEPETIAQKILSP